MAVPATALLWSLGPLFAFGLGIAAVMVNAWWGGFRAAALTTVLALLTLLLVFSLQIPPYDPEAAREFFFRLAMFALVGLLAGFLGQQCRQGIRAVDQLHDLLDGSGLGFIAVDMSGRVTSLNFLASTLTGWGLPHAQGTRLDRLFLVATGPRGPIVPLPLEEVMAHRRAAELPEGALLRSADGGEIAVEGTVGPVCDPDGECTGTMIIFRRAGLRAREVAEQRRQAEVFRSLAEESRQEQLGLIQTLRESEHRLRRLLENLPGFAFIQGPDSISIMASPDCEKLFEKHPGSWPGLGTPDPAEGEADLANPEGTGFGESVESVEADGQRRYFLLRRFPLQGRPGEDEVLGGLAIEVTDLEEAQQALRQTQGDRDRELKEFHARLRFSEEQLRRAHADFRQMAAVREEELTRLRQELATRPGPTHELLAQVREEVRQLQENWKSEKDQWLRASSEVETALRAEVARLQEEVDRHRPNEGELLRAPVFPSPQHQRGFTGYHNPSRALRARKDKKNLGKGVCKPGKFISFSPSYSFSRGVVADVG